MIPTKTIYISIGNSDDKLKQAEWSRFIADTYALVDGYSAAIHFAGYAAPGAPWQNACWCIEIEPDRIRRIQMPNDHREVRTEDLLRERLAQIAAQYGQESIAWAEATTEFIAPPPSLQSGHQDGIPPR